MSSVAISVIVFGCVFGGALLGMVLRAALPGQHLTRDSKETVQLGIGLVATMAALVLGLLVASAKSSYDTQGNELTDMSSKLVLLDRVLAHYGPEANDARAQLRSSVVSALDSLRRTANGGASRSAPSNSAEVLYDKIQRLSPKDDSQRGLQSQALSLAVSLGQTRWLSYEQRVTSVSVPLLIVLIFWLTIIFISLGLFAPRNATVLAALSVCSLSVSGAIFLILELSTPYGGLIQISSAPLRAALEQLGK